MLGSHSCAVDFQASAYSEGQWAIPDASECLQQSELRLIPGLFLLLTAPVLVYRFLYGKDTRGSPDELSDRVYNKLRFSFLLHLNGLLLAISDIAAQNVSIFFPAAFVLSLTLALVLVFFCQQRGVYSSGVLFCYSLLLVVCSLPEFRFRLERFIYEGSIDGPRFYFTAAFFPLAVVQTILHCFSDYKWSLLTDPKQSPEQKSSFLNQLLYSWCTEKVLRGKESPPTIEDVFDISEENSCKQVLKSFARNWDSAPSAPVPSDSEKEPLIEQPIAEKSIVLPLMRTHKWMLVVLLLNAVADISGFVVPVVLGRLIDFTGDLSQPAWVGFGWAIGLFALVQLFAIIKRSFSHRVNILQMNMSSTLTSMIYTKSLRLSNEARKGRADGEIVNLMSVDVEVVTSVFDTFISIATTPLTIVIGVYMLYDLFGIAAFVGFCTLLLLMVPSSYFVTYYSEKCEDALMETRDERLKMTNEILNGMKAVKMHAWEDSVKLIVQKLRDKELGFMSKMVYMTAFLHSCYGCIHFFTTGSTFAAYVLMDPEKNVLTPQVAFVALSLFDLIYSPVEELPFIFGGAIRFFASNKRLKSFMNEKELVKYVETTEAPEGVVSVKNASFSWDSKNGKKTTLREITMAVPKGELVAVVGEVGSGKSSLVAALLGEMTKESGSVHVAGSVAYVPQQAWIQNCSLKSNVLFGTPLDDRFYAAVLDACALKPDLEMLAAGDATEIGERGINLSGGQKQRVSVARAVYSQRDVYLLDDPLSAVDAHVGKHLFENVISSESGLLKDKTRILVTHGVHFLKYCDRVIVLKGGEISEQGTYQDLIAARGAFAEFLEEFLVKKVMSRRRTATESEGDENGELEEILAELGPLSGEIKKRLETQMSVDVAEESENEEECEEENDEEEEDEGVDSEEEEEDGQLIKKESLLTGNVKMSVYATYFTAAGNFTGTIFLLTYLVCGYFKFENSVWLAEWSDRSLESDGENSTYSQNVKWDLAGYIGFAAGEAFFYCIRTIVFSVGLIRASRFLHDALLRNILRLPMSFFDTTPLGRILNRFGKDVEAVDEGLPDYVEETFLNVYETALSLIIVIRGSTLSIPLIVFILVLNKVIVSYYLASSRQLRRLHSITRSPIYSHFQESLQGAVSIRAYGCFDRFLDESQRRMDLNQSTSYYSVVLNQWLGIRLEFLGALLTLSASLVAVFFRESGAISAGIIGMAVSHSLKISNELSTTMRMITGLENNIVSVERIKEYMNLTTEAALESPQEQKPPEQWPEAGAIEIEELSIRYREGLDLVLKGISAKIAAGEKIGIVGRTGAGKSSLTLALFRIVEADSGRILIDGRDIAEVGLKELRSKLTIVPQDPVLFSGSFRMNLDPFGEFEDSRVWEALEVASLREFVEALPERLEHEVAEGGENLSVGQRQLVCLARAVLHRTRILVLDEAAAALDLETDALIQRTIREHFKECTVLTIAHRLNTVIDNDRLLVLDAGRIKEFDSPKNLLADAQSQFHSMAKDAGLV